MRKLTTEEFIQECNIKHNNFYDYGKVVYTRSQNKITIICPKHGDFEQTPNSHLNRRGCSVCSGKKQLTLYQLLIQNTINGRIY